MENLPESVPLTRGIGGPVIGKVTNLRWYNGCLLGCFEVADRCELIRYDDPLPPFQGEHFTLPNARAFVSEPSNAITGVQGGFIHVYDPQPDAVVE